ncbi:MAG: energy transducer TonB [Bacteroidales bacterium]|nr:energy transducer TonB [Bacteroidales bacterium]
MKKLFFALVAVIVFASCTASPVKKLMKLHDEITAIQDKGGDEDALDKKVREIDKLIKENRRYKLTDDDHKTLNDLMESLAERTDGEPSNELLADIADCKTLGQVANALDIDEFEDYETLHEFVNGLFCTPVDKLLKLYYTIRDNNKKAQDLQERGRDVEAEKLEEECEQLGEEMEALYYEIEDYKLTSHDRKVLKGYLKDMAESSGEYVSDKMLVKALRKCKTLEDVSNISFSYLREEEYYNDDDFYYEDDEYVFEEEDAEEEVEEEEESVPSIPVLSDQIDIVEDDIKVDDDMFMSLEDDDAAIEIRDYKEAVAEEEVEEEAVPFQLAEIKPSFNGGDANEFSKWVNSRLVYPEIAKENGVQGRVTLSFTVEADGRLTNVRVLKGVDESLDKEAVRVVSSSPRWTPGKQRDKNVKVSYTFPVYFMLR